MTTSAAVASSTPLNSPNVSNAEMRKTLRKVFEVIHACAENGNDVLDLNFDGSPAMKKLKELIQEDVKSLKELREKFQRLNQAFYAGNQKEILANLRTMMDSVGKMSVDKLNKITDAVCQNETSRIRKRFETIDQELKKVRTNAADEKTKKLAEIVDERNKKVINCLNYAQRQLRILYEGNTSVDPTKQKKLIILGDTLQQKLPDYDDFELYGNIVIEQSERSQVSHGSRQHQPVVRHYLHGYLADEDGTLLQVMLELYELGADPMTYIDSTALTARFENTNESMPVEEIDSIDDSRSEEARRVIAIVSEHNTGIHQAVEVALVPTAAQAPVHGRIVELKLADTTAPTRRHTTALAQASYRPTQSGKRRASVAAMKLPKRSAKNRFKDVLRMVKMVKKFSDIRQNSSAPPPQNLPRVASLDSLDIIMETLKAAEEPREENELRLTNDQIELIEELTEEAANTIFKALNDPQPIIRQRGHNRTLPAKRNKSKPTTQRHNTLGAKPKSLHRPIDLNLQIVPSRISENDYEVRPELREGFVNYVTYPDANEEAFLARKVAEFNQVLNGIKKKPLQGKTVPLKMQTLQDPSRSTRMSLPYQSLPAKMVRKLKSQDEHPSELSLDSRYQEMVDQRMRNEAAEVAAQIAALGESSDENLDDISIVFSEESNFSDDSVFAD